MRKLKFISLALCFAIILSLFNGYECQAKNKKNTKTSKPKYEAGTIEDLFDKVTFSGKSFAAIDGETGEPIISYKETKKRRPASMTKMMTAIIAYENLPLKTKITATEESLRWHDRYDRRGRLIFKGLDNDMSTEHAVVGTTYKLIDWLHLLILCSDAEAADTIALGVAGSYEEFSDLMNEKAEELGMKNTYFDNPVGADFWFDEEKGEYDYKFDLISTAEDFAILTKAFMDIDELAEIAGKVTYDLPKSKDGSIPKKTIKNINHLVNIVGYPQFRSDLFTIIGTKTGYTEEAGRTIAVTAVNEAGRKVCLVYMSKSGDSSKKYYNESFKIMEYIFRYCPEKEYQEEVQEKDQP